MSTTAKRTQAESIVLVGILAASREMETLNADCPEYSPNWHRLDWATHQQMKEYAAEIGVRICHTKWLGLAEHNPTTSKAMQRALATLERDGFVDLIKAGWNRVRATHVRLTAEGRTLAESLANEGNSE